jgi:hypothetical protein
MREFTNKLSRRLFWLCRQLTLKLTHRFWRTQNSQPKRGVVSRFQAVPALAFLALALFSLLTPRSSAPAQAAAGINQQINFQARLFNAAGAVVPDGDYNIEFKIYCGGNGVPGTTAADCNSATDEQLLWTESRLNNNSQGVTVRNGYFSVQLGSITALSAVDFNDDKLWLSLNVGSTNTTCTPFSNCTPDGEMNPMQRFGSNAYALNSAKLQGLNKDQFVQLAQGLQADSSTTNASIAINKTGGTANILQLQKAGSDVLVVGNAGLITLQTASNVNGSLNHVTQSLTVANTTASATIRGSQQNMTISNVTNTATTTIGTELNVTDNATSIANINTGLKVTLAGSNTSQTQLGVDVSVNRGIAIRGTTTATAGDPQICADISNSAVGVCGDSTATSSNTYGVYGRNAGSGGAGVAGVNTSTGAAAGSYFGASGRSKQTAAAVYTSTGVYGEARGGSGSTTYGGYFTFDSLSTATLGSALYASNNTVAANILQLQDNTTDVLVVADSGATTFKNSTNSAAAFQIQSATAAQTLLSANTVVRATGTAGNSIKIGDSTGTDLDTTILQVDSASANPTTNLASLNGGIFYNSTSGKLNIVEGGAVKTLCNTTDLGCGGASGTFVELKSTTPDTAQTGHINVNGTIIAGTALKVGTASTTTGSLAFNNSINSNTVTIQSGTTSGSYSLTLPTAVGALDDCLRTNASGVLSWTACGAASGTMQGAYNASTTPATINTANDKNIVINAADTANDSGIIFNLQCATCTTGTNSNGGQFQIQAAGTNVFTLAPSGSTGVVTLTGTYLQKSGSATAFVLQNTSSENSLVFDGSTKHLKIYENVASPSRYADIFYDSSNNEAVFTASSGTTRIGSGSGNITIALTGHTDIVDHSKTYTATAAYSQSEFNIVRNITGGANPLTGNVAKIEDLSTFTTGSSAPNLLYINQNNTAATGNLILAQTGGGANDKFKVSTAGTVTIAAGQSYTGAGAVNVTAGASAALTLTGNAASTWSTSTGNLVLQAGGANTVVLKPGTDSTNAVQIQKAGGTSMLAFDSSANQIKVGVSDTTATLFVLDTKTDTGDPTGVNGGMYYNSNANALRCYENGTWVDCVGGVTKIYSFIDSTSDAAVDANTTDYWDQAAENGNAHPNITLPSTNLKVYGVITMEGQSTGTADVEVTARVERNIGSAPTCGSGTAVGGKPGVFATNTSATKSSTVTFLDDPATTSTVYYTLCSDADTVGTIMNITRIRFTFFMVKA